MAKRITKAELEEQLRRRARLLKQRDERIAALEVDVARVAELEETLAAVARTLGALVVRAAREVTDIRTRANILDDLQGIVPDALVGESENMQPAALRARAAMAPAEPKQQKLKKLYPDPDLDGG